MNTLVVIIVVLVIVLAVLIVAYVLYNRDSSRFTFAIGDAVPTASGGTDMSNESSFKSRIRGLEIFAGATLAALVARLWQMQLVSGADYTRQAESNRTRSISVDAPRGRILDRNGTELVTNRVSLVVVAKPDVVNDEVEVKLLANLIGMPSMAVKRKIEDQTQGAQSLRTVSVDVSRRVVAFIGEHPYLFDGVSIEEKTQRSYPLATLAAHVLGYVGTVTQDQLSNNENATELGKPTYESGDIVGQAGVEYQYEDVLQGIKGEQQVYVDANGKVLSQAGSVSAQAGADIALTLDANLQQVAETSLANRIKTLKEAGRADCNGGAALCMDVTNGEILCMASYPTFAPSIFTGGVSNDDWQNLSSEASNNPLLNRAISGLYPSASTIKPLSAIAALKNGIATLDSSYDCTGYWTGFGTAYGQYCWNKNGHGIMTIQTGITFSCDVVFYEIGKGFFNSSNQEGMQQVYRDWGLGQKEGIDLPSEGEGRVPDANWKWNYFTWAADDARAWQGGDLTNLAIGQGDLLVTPLQMTSVYAGLATGGEQMRPHLLKEVRTADGSGSVVAYNPEVVRTTQENETYLAGVKRGLWGVIYEESAAQASHFTNLSVQVAGKTGTAETSKNDPHGWFIAYAPYDNPKYVVCALIENGGFGSDGAMYVVRDILGGLYNEPDTSTQVDTTGAR